MFLKTHIRLDPEKIIDVNCGFVCILVRQQSLVQKNTRNNSVRVCQKPYIQGKQVVELSKVDYTCSKSRP